MSCISAGEIPTMKTINLPHVSEDVVRLFDEARRDDIEEQRKNKGVRTILHH
jgi:hypothetical protein